MSEVLENSLRVKINAKELTAEVIKSPNIKGTVIVPRYAISEKKKYKIITIGDYAFYEEKFDSLIFAEESEVESFKYKSFYYASFKKLQIPPKLKELGEDWCNRVKDLIDIEVSPKNERQKIEFERHNKEFENQKKGFERQKIEFETQMTQMKLILKQMIKQQDEFAKLKEQVEKQNEELIKQTYEMEKQKKEMIEKDEQHKKQMEEKDEEIQRLKEELKMIKNQS